MRDALSLFVDDADTADTARISACQVTRRRQCATPDLRSGRQLIEA
jgi:hypothetical protein